LAEKFWGRKMNPVGGGDSVNAKHEVDYAQVLSITVDKALSPSSSVPLKKSFCQQPATRPGSFPGDETPGYLQNSLREESGMRFVGRSRDDTRWFPSEVAILPRSGS
jgi:hypothetical protein